MFLFAEDASEQFEISGSLGKETLGTLKKKYFLIREEIICDRRRKAVWSEQKCCLIATDFFFQK